MDGAEQFFRTLAEERKAIAAKLSGASDDLKTLALVAKMQDLVSALAPYRRDESLYPGYEELGIPLEQLVDSDFTRQLMPAIEENKRRKGHIDLLLTTFSKTVDEMAALRAEMRKLGNAIVEFYLRLAQIDTVLNALLQFDPAPTEPSEFAKRLNDSPL